jgi:hypothetical protein
MGEKMNFLLMATEKDFYNEKSCFSTKTFEATSLPEILPEIEAFLRGAGFYIKNLDYDTSED